jgi:high-affinity Fe2+/Pb2+ permease
MYLFIFLTLYMFRPHRAHHQERKIVSIQPLVAVTLCHVQVGSGTSDLHTTQWHTTQPLTQNDSYHRLY